MKEPSNRRIPLTQRIFVSGARTTALASARASLIHFIFFLIHIAFYKTAITVLPIPETLYLFPTDICVPNSRIIEYSRRILSKPLKYRISYLVVRISNVVAHRPLFVHHNRVRRFKRSGVPCTPYRTLSGFSIKNPEFRLFLWPIRPFYLLQRFSIKNVTYNSGKKWNKFQKRRKAVDIA